MAYRNLREWLEEVDKVGELVRIEGAHCDEEACAVTALTRNKMVLFDKFPGYAPGYRMLASIARDKLERFLSPPTGKPRQGGLP